MLLQRLPAQLMSLVHVEVCPYRRVQCWSLPAWTAAQCLSRTPAAPPLHPAGAAQLLTDFPIFSAGTGESPAVADSSYKNGRAADATSLVVGGGRAAVFTPNPYGGLQWYIKWPLNKLDGNKYSGLAFKLAADSEFAPEVTTGIQVQPDVVKASRAGV